MWTEIGGKSQKANRPFPPLYLTPLYGWASERELTQGPGEGARGCPIVYTVPVGVIGQFVCKIPLWIDLPNHFWFQSSSVANPCSFPLSLLQPLKLRCPLFSHAMAVRLSWGNLLLMASETCMGIFTFWNTVTSTTSFAFYSNPLWLPDVSYVHFIYTDTETQGAYWHAGSQAHSY